MTNTITIATLKKGAESLGLEIPAKPTKKALEASIEEKLSTMELGYECPSCGKDIPDIDVCPYCSENFAEDAGGSDEQGELNLEAEDNNIINATENSGEDKIQDANPTAEVEKEPVKDTTPKSKNDNARKKDETKVKAKSGKDSEEYQMLITEIDNILSGEDISKKDNASGITYLVDKKRLMKVAATTKSISIELNEAIETDDDNVKHYSEAEAKAKHLGTVRAIYSFGDLETALSLVKQAYEIRMGKVAVETK